MFKGTSIVYDARELILGRVVIILYLYYIYISACILEWRLRDWRDIYEQNLQKWTELSELRTDAIILTGVFCVVFCSVVISLLKSLNYSEVNSAALLITR